MDAGVVFTQKYQLIEQIKGLSKADQDALIMLMGMTVGKVASAATGASSTASNATAITTKLAAENNYLKHREITALAEKLKACDQAADPMQCRKSTWSDANAVGRDRQFRKCDDAAQCRDNRDEIWADRQELAARQEELGRKLYAGQLTKDEEQEYLINSQQLSLMGSAWEEANRQVREQIPFSEWTAAERAQTFQDAMVTLGGLGAAGAVGSVRLGAKNTSVVENNLLPHEVKQVKQLTSDLGGKFVGAPKLTPGERLNGKTLASSATAAAPRRPPKCSRPASRCR
jgi:hypothetical protein